MNKERLLALADYMETVKKSQYSQNTWIDGLKPGKFEEEKVVGLYERRQIVPKEGFCGTSACVLGHAAFAPGLKDAGLFLSAMKGSNHELFAFEVNVRDAAGTILDGFETGAHVFDIPVEHAAVMFGSLEPDVRRFYTGSGRKTPTTKDVAAALRLYVETDGESIRPFLSDED